jgi:DNA-binding response OmpR family regulator
MNEKNTILLVEDDPLDAQLMQLAVRNSDSPFFLLRVCDGEKAIQYLSREKEFSDLREFPEPFLVVLDLALPLVSGFEVLRWMQAQAKPMPPVIVLSHSLMERDRRLAYELGAKLFVPKPPNFEGTIALVRSLGSFCQNNYQLAPA